MTTTNTIHKLASILNHDADNSYTLSEIRLSALECAVTRLNDVVGCNDTQQAIESLDKACVTAYEDNKEEHVTLATSLLEAQKRIQKLEAVVTKMLNNPKSIVSFAKAKSNVMEE